MADLVNMSDQFGGLPMEALIGGPLQAACKAQVSLAGATTSFIESIGFEKVGDKYNVRTVDFSFNRAVNGVNGAASTETVDMKVPLLSIVKIPSLAVDSVDITFDMEVKSSDLSKESSDTSVTVDANASAGFGWFKASLDIKGSVASHKENTRSSDNSAKYHVQVRASQGDAPEGLSRILDILNTAVAPVPQTAATTGTTTGTTTGSTTGATTRHD